MFPQNAKLVSVTPVDKKTDGNDFVLNSRSINVWNCLSNVYKNILKTTGWKNEQSYFSFYLCAQRNVQHATCTYWRVEKNLRQYCIGAILMELSKPFYCISLRKKWSFPLRISSVNVTKSATANLVTFTEEILNGKLHFLCRVSLILSLSS